MPTGSTEIAPATTNLLLTKSNLIVAIKNFLFDEAVTIVCLSSIFTRES